MTVLGAMTVQGAMHAQGEEIDPGKTGRQDVTSRGATGHRQTEQLETDRVVAGPVVTVSGRIDLDVTIARRTPPLPGVRRTTAVPVVARLTDRSRGPRPDGRRDWQPRDNRQGRPYAPPRPAQLDAVDTAELLGGEEELIAGRRPVEEAFAARRDAVRLLVVPERRAALDQLVIHATTLRIPVVELEGGSLTALAGFDGHQGVALVAKPRPQADLESILASARARNEPPFVLVLDSLEDPQNFGTLLRSGEAVGVHGVVYPTRRAAPLSPSAIKASAGATEHLLLAAVEDLPGTLADLHGRGLRIVAAEEDAALDYTDADLRGPIAMIVGSEGKGISAAVRRRIDLSVRIPMRGKIASLNAAVAGSVLLFAAAQQRPLAPALASAETAEPTTSLAPAEDGPEAEPKAAKKATAKAPKPKAAAKAAKSAAETTAKSSSKAKAAKTAKATAKAAPKAASKAKTESKAKPETKSKATAKTAAKGEPKTPRKKANAEPTPPADEELLPTRRLGRRRKDLCVVSRVLLMAKKRD